MQKNIVMKRLFAIVIIYLVSVHFVDAQIVNKYLPPHLYNHTFPEISEPNSKIQAMIEDLKVEELQADVDHLCSYHNRRAKGPYIYEVQDWLVSEFQSFGIDTVVLHQFKPINTWGYEWGFETAANVLAVQKGTKYPNEYVICGGHYDSTVKVYEYDDPYADTLRSPGADDNASGTAGILATARILSKYNFERTIIYAAWNAEECGLCGSSEFAKDCAADSIDIVAYTNLDMTGYLEPGNEMVINLLYTNCDSLLGDFMKQIIHSYYPEIKVSHAWLNSGDTDYSSFNRNGYQAISLSEDVNNMSPFIHSINDIVGVSLNNYDQSMLFTGVTLAAVAELAGLSDLSVDENVKENLQVFPNPASDIVKIKGDFQSLDVFDLTGKHVFNTENQDEIDVSNWNTGIYIIKSVTFDGMVFTNKFFVKH